ncbi:MAG: DUF1570 domain-containing protein [Planctomycetaceae bacterium]
MPIVPMLFMLLWTHGCSTTRDSLNSGLPSRHAMKGQQVLLLSDGNADRNDEVLEELERVRGQVMELLSIPASDREVVVYLFSDDQRYATYMKKKHPSLPSRRAFFIGTPRELSVYAFWGDQTMVDLRHEYTHGFLHSTIGHVPLWVDEGLAEYFEVGSRVAGGVNGEHLTRLKAAAANGWRPDIRRLEQLESVDQMQRADYQEAWLWIHFLMHEAPQGRRLLSEYLNDLRLHRPAATLAERIQKEHPDAETGLVDYLLRLSA